MKYKLLIAEEDPLERQAICRMLHRHLGCRLIIFDTGTGAQALEIYNLEEPQIVILNTGLPAPNGLDVARRIRETGNICAIVFISDVDDFSYAREAISLRAMEYILKPWDENKLLHCVEESIQYCSHLQALSYPVAKAHIATQTLDDGRLALVRADIRAYIDAHYMEELSMKTVAHAMNYSEPYFCKLFKQCFQVNFSTYLNQYRIHKATVMMRTSRSSVKDISTACGYTDANYFARVFKRITDLTPSEYRISLSEKQ